MQKLFFVACFFFLSQMLVAQGFIKNKKDNLWGFTDSLGAVVIPHQYETVYPFSGALAVVKKGNFWGFINKKNEAVVPFIYQNVQMMSAQNLVKAQRDSLWDLLDLQGKRIGAGGFESIGMVRNYKAVVQKNGKFGLLDVDGHYILKPKYDLLEWTGDKIKLKKNGKFGYKMQDGKRAVPLKYDAVKEFQGNRVFAMRNEKWGLLDEKGKKILKFKFDFIGEFTYESYLEGNYAPYIYGENVGKISTWGASVPFNYEEVADEVLPQTADLTVVRFGKYYGAVNGKGKVVINALYTSPIKFSEGVAAVQKDGKFGFIDETGKIVYPFILDAAENFTEGRAAIKKNGVPLILNRAFEVIEN